VNGEPPREGDAADRPLRPAPGPPPLPPTFPPRRGAVAAPRSERYVREKKFPWPLVILLGAAPIAAVVYVILMPTEKRTKFLDAIPQGVGARAVTAVISLALLVVLARLVLPGAKGAVGGLTRALWWFKAKHGWRRVVWWPAEALVGLAWFLAQVVFAVDMVLVIACGIAFVLYVVKIAKPELFPFLPGG
jgi:hypothetical protein